MATTEEIINCIRYGLDSTWIMTQADTSHSKLRRALESPQMIHRLRTEELLGRMQMRLRAVRHLPRAIDGLVRLMDAAEPEAARKACLVVIAAATGINLANPAVPVYPEEVVDAAQLVDHPEDKARRQEAEERDRQETEHAAYVESLKDLIARWDHHPPAEAPAGDVLAQVEAAVKDKMDRTYRDEDAEGELPGPRVPNPAYASEQEMREYSRQKLDPPAEAAAGPTGDDEAENDNPDDEGPAGGMAIPTGQAPVSRGHVEAAGTLDEATTEPSGDDDGPDGGGRDDGARTRRLGRAQRVPPSGRRTKPTRHEGGTRKSRRAGTRSQPTPSNSPPRKRGVRVAGTNPRLPAGAIDEGEADGDGSYGEVFKSGPECQNPADSGRPGEAGNSQDKPDSALTDGSPAGAPAEGGPPPRRPGRGRGPQRPCRLGRAA